MIFNLSEHSIKDINTLSVPIIYSIFTGIVCEDIRNLIPLTETLFPASPLNIIIKPRKFVVIKIFCSSIHIIYTIQKLADLADRSVLKGKHGYYLKLIKYIK